MKEKILIYPYDFNMTPLLRHNRLLDNYEIVGVVSPIGWNLCGKDAGYADFGEPTGFKVETDFNNLIVKCDTVWICDSEIKLDFERIIYPKILDAVNAGKNVICCIAIDINAKENIKLACKDNKVYFKSFIQGDSSQDIPVYLTPNKLRKINTPVVFVAGVSCRTHKFEIQLGLREKFIDLGYTISQVGTRCYCELINFHSFPTFMFSSFISESSKIHMFNQFIKNIENTEKPDVIIIGIPGGVMPINSTFVNNFGILAFEVSQAVTPDASILSLLYEDFKPTYFDMITTSLKYKLGFELDCFNMANVNLDWNSTREHGKLIFTTFDSRYIDGKDSYRDLKVPVFNALSENSLSSMVEYLVNRLEEYADAEVL